MQKLDSVPVPDCLQCRNVKCDSGTHTDSRDGFVLDILGAVIEASHATIPMTGGRQDKVKPDSGCMPGWKEEVEPYRKASIFWHSVWLSAGRPNQGQLFEIMKATRNRFKYALRRVRRAADAIKARKLFEASLWGGGDLLAELRKTRGGKHTPDLPESVAGANGVEEVCQKFRQVYSELYSSADTSEEMVEIKSRIEESVTDEGFEEIQKITMKSVKTAAHMMKKGKADVSGSYCSYAIRLAPDS